MSSSLTDTAVALPSFSEVIAVLTLQAGYNAALVVIGATLLGCAAGIIGTFTLLRKRSMMADALAHAALPGLAAAYIFLELSGYQGKGIIGLLCGAAVSGVCGVLVVQFLSARTRLSEDTAIGIVLSVFFGAGVLLLGMIQSESIGNPAGLHHFIFGQTAAMTSDDALLLGGGALLVTLIAVLLVKEFRIVGFDANYAVVQGWPVGVLDLILMGLVVFITMIGLQAVGLILIVSFLTIPAVAARFWSERLSTTVGIAALLGALSGYVGASISALQPRLPAGAVIVLTSGVIFLISFFIAPARGLGAKLLKGWRLQARILQEHLLRGAYEAHEVSPLKVGYLAPEVLRTVPWFSRAWLLGRLFRHGLVSRTPRGDLILSADGLVEAERLTQNHRLWEQYVLAYGGLSPSHVDLSADFAEHHLSAPLVAELRRELGLAGVKGVTEILPSAHPLGEVVARDASETDKK